MNYNGPKVKLSRKLSIELTPKSGKYTSASPIRRGQHEQQKEEQNNRISGASFLKNKVTAFNTTYRKAVTQLFCKSR